MRRVAALFGSALLTACACTQVGCGNRLEFDLPFDVAWGGTYAVAVCVDDACTTDTLRPTETFLGSAGPLSLDVALDALALDLGQDAQGGTRRVTLSVQDPDGVVLAAMDADIALERFEPNGWPCGPTCWRAHVRAESPAG
jgi:hypothetical protein